MDTEPTVETRVVLSADPENVPQQPRFSMGVYNPFGSASIRGSYVQVEDERHGPVNVTPHMKMLVEKDRRESCPQRTDGWYAKRRNNLTASAIATAAGKNPYETRLQLIRKKVFKEPAWKGNVATEHGNKYEDEAVEKYEAHTGHKVLHFGLLESLHRDPEKFDAGDVDDESYIAGSPDGITSDGRLIEVKCPYRRAPNGTVPHHYMFQLQCLMNILDLEVCDFIEYVPETYMMHEQLWIVEVKRSRAFWKHYMPVLRRLWDDVIETREEVGDAADGPPPEKKPRAPPKKRHHPMLACMETVKGEMGGKIEAYAETDQPKPKFYKSKLQGDDDEEHDVKAAYGETLLVDLSSLKH